MMMKRKPVTPWRTSRDSRLPVRGCGVKVAKALGFALGHHATGDIYVAQTRVSSTAYPALRVLISRSFHEVTKYAIDVDLGTTLLIAMNQNTFNKFSPDAQKVFDKLSGDWAVRFYRQGMGQV